MSDKPSYIGTLNAIVNGERQGYQILNCLAGVCDPAVQPLIKTVALREAEHAATFEKRLCELGYSLREKPSPDLPGTLEMITSDLSDLEKFEKLGYHKLGSDDGEDRLLQVLADKTIDPVTAGLLGRFVAEERDSARLLESAYECVNGDGPQSAKPVDDKLDQVCQQLDRLTAEVQQLRTKVDGPVSPPRKSWLSSSLLRTIPTSSL